MDGVFTCQPEGFDALRAQNCVINRLCRSLHGAFYSLFCIPNCVKRSRETCVNRTSWRNSDNFRGFTPAWRVAITQSHNRLPFLDHPLRYLDVRAHIVRAFHGTATVIVDQVIFGANLGLDRDLV